MKSLQPETAVPLSDVDSNWHTSLLQPLRNIISGGREGLPAPGATYGAEGRLTSTCSGVPSKVRTRPVQTTNGCPPAGETGLPADSAVPFSVGHEGSAGAASAAGDERAPAPPAARAPAARRRAVRGTRRMFEKRTPRPSSCGAGVPSRRCDNPHPGDTYGGEAR